MRYRLQSPCDGTARSARRRVQQYRPAPAPIHGNGIPPAGHDHNITAHTVRATGGEISLISPTADKSYAQIKLLLPHDRAGCLASPPRTHQGFSFTRMYIKAIYLLRSTHHSLHANLNRAFAKVCLLREHPQGRPSGRIAPQPETTQQQHVYQAVRRAHRGRGAFYVRECSLLYSQVRRPSPPREASDAPRVRQNF